MSETYWICTSCGRQSMVRKYAYCCCEQTQELMATTREQFVVWTFGRVASKLAYMACDEIPKEVVTQF